MEVLVTLSGPHSSAYYESLFAKLGRTDVHVTLESDARRASGILRKRTFDVVLSSEDDVRALVENMILAQHNRW